MFSYGSSSILFVQNMLTSSGYEFLLTLPSAEINTLRVFQKMTITCSFKVTA